ncbi:hypothetical protein SAMN05428987_3092 [Paenibacillus sp. CF095]|nr:hypothetical protein SAMN05428987_3092 [Paenibacillus sp. CF095]
MKNQNQQSKVAGTFGYQPRPSLEISGLQPKASGKTLNPPKGGSSVKKP